MTNMKLKVLYVKQLPAYYKQSSDAEVLHLRFAKEDAFIKKDDNEKSRKQYLESIKAGICEEIKNVNMVARPEAVKVNGEYFVIFKSNLDKRMLEVQLRNLILEMNEYTGGLLSFSYVLQTLMIMEEGKEPSLFGALKMGEDYFKSEPTKIHEINTEATKSRTKFFPSYEEYSKDKEEVSYDYFI